MKIILLGAPNSGKGTLAGNIKEKYDGFVVEGGAKLNGDAELQTYHDHRLAMSFYVAGLVCEKEIAIEDFEWIDISFPEFEKLIESLK